MRMRKTKPVTLVIDADSLIYQAAAAHEIVFPSEEVDPTGLPLYLSYHSHPPEVMKDFWSSVVELEERFNAKETFICITDSAENFRLTIDPTYKGNRKHVRKPLSVKLVRDTLSELPNVHFKPTLEADDVCGILMTMKKHAGDNMLCWSPDKDLRSIPGRHVGMGKGEPKIVTVSLQEADQAHLLQTVAGDSTDGYPGLSGVGMKTGRLWFEKHGWTWEAALELARKHGRDEEYLLRQARLARILRATDYDFERKVPLLWEPERA
jgi:DNA polymerase-1